MSQKDRLLGTLKQGRELTSAMLGVLKTPEDWTYQVHPKANHPLWIAGHLGHADNFFLSMMVPEKAAEKEGWAEAFCMGSQPTGKIDEYPAVDEVLGYFNERRETLLAVLEGFTDADLERKTPEGTPEMFGTFGQVLEMAIWHEGVHSGQLSVAHRGLGHPPVFSAPPEPANA